MELVKSITSDHDLIELAKRIGVRLDGIYAIQEVEQAQRSETARLRLETPSLKQQLKFGGAYIILLRSDGGVGHWVAVHDKEYFDPFGVGPPSVLGPLKYSEIQYQGTYSEYCGIYCLLWLYCKQNNRMNLLKQFNNLDIDVV